MSQEAKAAELVDFPPTSSSTLSRFGKYLVRKDQQALKIAASSPLAALKDSIAAHPSKDWLEGDWTVPMIEAATTCWKSYITKETLPVVVIALNLFDDSTFTTDQG